MSRVYINCSSIHPKKIHSGVLEIQEKFTVEGYRCFMNAVMNIFTSCFALLDTHRLKNCDQRSTHVANS